MIASLDRRADHKPAQATILISAAIAGLVLLALVYLAAVAPRGVPLLPYYYVHAQFRNAENIRVLSTVQIAGRRVGQVSDITYDHGLARLTLQMLPGTQKLTSGATARIRVKNPIGAKYVEVTPSASGTSLRSGDTLPASHTSTAVDTQTLLSGFDAPTRSNLRASLIGLGQGFLGRGQGINETLPLAAPVLSNLESLSNAILSISGAAAGFAPSANSLAAAYDPVRQELGAGFRPQAEVLQDFADQRGSLQATLDIAPGSLSALRQGLAQAQPLLEQTAGFARATVAFTRPAPAALQAATTLLRTGVPSLQRTLPLLRAIGTAVTPTDELLNRVDPVISPSLRALANQMQPLSNLGARPCDFLTQTINWRSAMAWGVPAGYDPTSNLTTPEPGLGPNVNSFRVLALPETSTETLNADAPGSFPHGNNAYPPPCAAPSQVLK
jgi:phospholipid/cholesterol/gamma-HCH transport system substrate-binding protein